MIISISVLILLLPLIGSLILLFNRDNKLYTSIIANVAVGIPMILSIFLLVHYLNDFSIIYSDKLFIWYANHNVIFGFGILVDSLTVIMSFIVTFISFFVHVYSITYMEKDPSINRFFIYTNFFTFSMLLIIFSDNFLQLFIGWELVGLSSYLLIGFWYKKNSAVNANLKAFLVNRVGDIGLLLGVIIIFLSTKSLDYNVLFNSLPQLTTDSINFLGSSLELLPLVALLLFIGAAAKSAQIPLHFWLPDSMEGPTPISALIHAATMVTAGIFMVARLSPLYDLSTYVLDLILIIGVSTAFLMGLVALVQNDIKRIIAYSTISQLGYMTAALGMSFYSFAIFHLLTHAFFKALLFLCAGSIILKCHHEQDIDKMGGLRNIMPITFFTFLLAGLALIGFPLTSGFFSKDLIIDIYKYNNHFAYYLLIGGILITTLYTSKIFLKVFFGKNKLNITKSDTLENNDSLIIPLVVLSVPSVLIGWVLFDNVLFNNFFATSISDSVRIQSFYSEHIIHSSVFVFHSFTSLSFWALMIGLVTSYYIYNNNIMPDKFINKLAFLKSILLSEYGFSHLSDKIIPIKVKSLSDYFWRKYDIRVIDKFFINGTAYLVSVLSSKLRMLQTGYLYHYAFTMIIGLLIFLILFLYF